MGKWTLKRRKEHGKRVAAMHAERRARAAKDAKEAGNVLTSARRRRKPAPVADGGIVDRALDAHAKALRTVDITVSVQAMHVPDLTGAVANVPGVKTISFRK